MSTIIIVLAIIVAILLILVVLIQNSKGGGLATGTSANQVMGVQKTADFLEKLTWGLATVLLVLSLTSKMFYSTNTVATVDSELKEQAAESNPVAPISKPTAPVALPGDSNKK